MRRVFIFLALMVLPALWAGPSVVNFEYIAPPPPEATLPATAKFVSWWTLQERDADTTWHDSHGTFHLAENGTPAAITGKVGGGVDFNDAESDRLNNASFSNTFHQNDFAVGGWFYSGDTGESQGLVQQWEGGSTSGTRHWQLIRNADSTVTFRIANTAGTNSIAVSNSAFMSAPGVWYFIVGVRESDVLKLYVNGILQTTTADVSSVTEQTSAIAIRIFASLPTYYDGGADEVFVCNTYLTASEVYGLWNDGDGVTYTDLP